MSSQVCLQTEPGDVIRPGVSRYIAGEGMPAHKQIFNKGKLFIDFDVVFPTKGQLNAEQVCKHLLVVQSHLLSNKIGALAKALPAPAAAAPAVPPAGQALEEVELVEVSVEALATLEKERDAKKRPTQDTEEDEEDDDPRRGPGGMFLLRIFCFIRLTASLGSSMRTSISLLPARPAVHYPSMCCCQN